MEIVPQDVFTTSVPPTGQMLLLSQRRFTNRSHKQQDSSLYDFFHRQRLKQRSHLTQKHASYWIQSQLTGCRYWWSVEHRNHHLRRSECLVFIQQGIGRAAAAALTPTSGWCSSCTIRRSPFRLWTSMLQHRWGDLLRGSILHQGSLHDPRIDPLVRAAAAALSVPLVVLLDHIVYQILILIHIIQGSIIDPLSRSRSRCTS